MTPRDLERSLDELRARVELELGNDWSTPSRICSDLGLGYGTTLLRVQLILERLANDGVAELKTPGGKVRRFRRRPAP